LARKIWDSPEIPTRDVSAALGIERWQLRAAIHKIKASSDLSSTDRVTIYDDGTVTDQNGDWLGNIHDEL
jgi:hypothetical protein